MPNDYLEIDFSSSEYWRKCVKPTAKAKEEYKYFCLSRPPSLDMGDDRLRSETFSPPRLEGAQCVHGYIVYPHRLDFEYIHKNSLLPEDLKEQAEMIFWQEPEETRTDYLAANPKLLHAARYKDCKAWAALILLDLI